VYSSPDPPHWTVSSSKPSPLENEMIERQIEATDGQTDRLVYELYELTEEEIKIVEGGESREPGRPV